jgi:hypothetical protein
LAISQSEAEEKERQKKNLTNKYALSTIVPASPVIHPLFLLIHPLFSSSESFGR